MQSYLSRVVSLSQYASRPVHCRCEPTQHSSCPTHAAPFVEHRCHFTCNVEAYWIIGGCSPYSLGLCQFSIAVFATSVILVVARLEAVMPTRNTSARCFVPYGTLVNNFSGVKMRGRLTTWQTSCPTFRPVCNQSRPPAEYKLCYKHCDHCMQLCAIGCVYKS